jgi:hypothetical protein
MEEKGEGADVEADVVVEIRVPADGLIPERFPADEEVVGRFFIFHTSFFHRQAIPLQAAVGFLRDGAFDEIKVCAPHPSPPIDPRSR